MTDCLFGFYSFRLHLRLLMTVSFASLDLFSFRCIIYCCIYVGKRFCWARNCLLKVSDLIEMKVNYSTFYYWFGAKWKLSAKMHFGLLAVAQIYFESWFGFALDLKYVLDHWNWIKLYRIDVKLFDLLISVMMCLATTLFM